MATLMDMKKKARRLGMSAADARGADREELQDYIDQNSNSTKPRKKAAVAKKKITTGRVAKRKPGRPKGSTTRKPQARKANGATGNGHSRSTDGRHILSKIDYGKTKGWNPRPGSPPDRIIKSLKKHRGNRDKVFTELKASAFDFTGRKKRDGSKRSKAEAEQMLKYRISRTAWQFALATKQHKVATKRVEYGTGDYATTRKKARRGRPKGSTTRKRPAARSTGRKPTSTRRRGRPRTRK
jgi:hypothetical protein